MSKSKMKDPVLLDAIEQYGWEPISVKQKGNIWKVKCEDGVYALKRAKASREKLLLLHSMFEKGGSDSPQFLPWLKTKDGSPVFNRGRVCLYATPWKEQKELDNVPSATIMKSLASFHRWAESAVKPYPELRKDFTNERLNSWQQNGEAIPKYGKNREEREFQSPFDKCFSRCEEMLERVVDFSVNGLEKFFELEKGKAPRYTLCHKRFHPRHIVQDDNDFFFINFDHAEVESPIEDIAASLRRLSDPVDEEHPLELFEAYDSVNKLLPMEKKLLALHLAYPERLLKTLNRYYVDTKVSQNELTSLQRLEKEVSQLEQFEELIKTLWNTKKGPEATKKAVAPIKVARTRKGKTKQVRA